MFDHGFFSTVDRKIEGWGKRNKNGERERVRGKEI
jgi:hypothetical protein